MKKLIALTFLLCSFALLLSSCGSSNDVKIEKPENTNLEYWLLDSPYNKEWVELPNSHWLDDRDYLAKGYDPIVDDNGNLSKPEKYVMYTVGNYPLYDFGVKKIRTITITDPDVYVWGLTINSTRDEVISTIEQHGFIKQYDNDGRFTARNGNYMIAVQYNKSIQISYVMSSIIEKIYTLGA